MVDKKKDRSKKYEKKLSINGSFEDVVKTSMGNTPTRKKEEKKPALKDRIPRKN